MTYVLSFPSNNDAEPYDCETMADVRDAVREEIRKSVSDMGSDGYDLDWATFDPATLNQLPLDQQEEMTEIARTRGIDNAVDAYYPRVMSLLATHKEARLPDLTWIRLDDKREDEA